ncbi:PAS domain S-box protein [Melioribacter sp. OK-6-Me]|uniref:PAS domain S-box protein n=1 Tax=unclassified Melioribacter TaxID=2627329 RepID=UPI003EDA2C29
MTKRLDGILYQFDLTENRFIYLEGEAMRVSGYPAKNFISGKLKWSEIIYKQDIKLFKKKREQLFKKKNHTANLIYRILHKNGSIRWIRDIAKLTKIDNHHVVNGILYDISEMIEEKERSKKVEFQFKSAVDNSPNIIFTVDRNLNFVYLNAAAEKVFGNLEKLDSKKVSNFISSPIIIKRKKYENDYVKKLVDEIYKGKKFKDVEIKYKDRNGKEIITIARIYPKLTHDGKIETCVFANTDITIRKQKEEKLRAIEKTIEYAHDPIFWVNSKGQIIYANKSACKELGYTKKELLSKTVFDIDPHVKKENWEQHWEKSIERRSYTFETEHKTRDGTIIPVEISVTSFEYNGEIIHSDIVRDISDRKKYEKEIIEAKEKAEANETKFKAAFYTSPDAVNINKLNGEYVEINEGFTRLTGYTEKDVIGKLSSEINIWAIPEDRDKLIAGLMKNGIVENLESLFRAKDGTLIPALMSAKIIYLKNEPHILSITKAIVERKQYENQLLIAKEKAEHSEKLKSAFLAQISHEIRSPLNRILGYVSLIKDFIVENLPEKTNESNEYFNGIEISSQRLIRTIDLILNMAELQTKSYQPLFKEFDLYERLLLLYNEYQNFASVKNLNFELKKKTDDTKILGDEYSVVQIFANLIDNAIKYTEKGSVKIIIDRNKRNQLFVDVADTGIGMSDEFQRELFKPFMQEEIGYSRKYEGNGLGLALVKNYCNINGAIITLKSKKNKGSIFRVVFNRRDFNIDST